MFNISLLADIEEEVVDQAAADQEEVVDIEEEVVEEAGKEEVAEAQPAAEEVKAEEAAPEAAPAEVKPTEAEITEDAKVEVAEAEEGGDIEVKDTEVLAESQILSAQFDELLSMQNHVEKFGVDRTFLSLFNKGGRLGRALGVNFPACESIDAVGYPTSALSMACLEAFRHKEKGVLAKIVDFIVALVKKIKILAVRFWTWFTGLFDNQATKWQKLQNASKNRVVTKDASRNTVVPALGIDFDADLGKRLQGLGFWNILKTVLLNGPARITSDNWADGKNARRLSEELGGVEHNISKATTVTRKNAGSALKRLANNIRVSFKEMDQVKRTLGELNERIKLAEDMVAKTKNGVEKTLNYDSSYNESSKRGLMSHRASETESKKLSFGTGNKQAVVEAKNQLIDLKNRQSVVQKVASVYTRSIRVMLRTYANVLFTMTEEK